MNPDDFRRALVGKFKGPSKEEAGALLYWIAYYVTTDAFDGGPGPPPPHLRAASDRFATVQRRKILELAFNEGISKEEMLAARDEACRISERPEAERLETVEWLKRVRG